MLLPIHIAAGGLAIVLGAIALSVKKGGTIHRRSGLLFVYTMLVMGVSASILSVLKGRDNGNVFAGVLTAYFVGTALTTVRPISSWTRLINAVALTVAVVLAVGCVFGGVRLINTPGFDSCGVSFRTSGVMSLIIGTVLVMAAAGDVRIMRFGMARGGPRLARHLWRMCFALFIAAGSFFSVRERVATILPEPFTTGPMRAMPILLVFATMFYWLWRLRGRRTLPVLVRHDSVPVAPRARIDVASRRRPEYPASSCRMSRSSSRSERRRTGTGRSLPFPELFEERDLRHRPGGRQRPEEGVDVC